ncbi:DUF6220 domain-containing protein [Microbacterium pumilum]|uniref:DUF6220 domain-containing protein n=1 Tax=Microbacterium pumilum TaxID=344165 RepID=UPI0031E06315
MRRFFEIAFSMVTILLVIAVVLQLYFAGMGVFSDPTDRLFAIHGWNGRVVLPLLILLSLLFAALARAGKRTIWLSALLVGLLALQTLIFVITGLVFNIGPETPHPPLAATMLLSLHPINGLAILVVSVIVAARAWKLAFARDAASVGSSAAPAPDRETIDLVREPSRQSVGRAPAP